MKRFPASRFGPVVLLLGLAASTTAARAGETPPAWLLQARPPVAPAYDPKVPAVVLLDEESLSLDETGHVVGTARYAVRILRYEGRAFAEGHQHYRTDGGKIRQVQAW